MENAIIKIRKNYYSANNVQQTRNFLVPQEEICKKV